MISLINRLVTVLGYTIKIDSSATSGLSGTNNSLAYRAGEIERHLHSYERWLGAAAAPVGETHVADAIGTTTTAFQVDAGNDTWGSWLQVLGSEDTPVLSGMSNYDLHRLAVVAVENANTTHLIQFAFGASGAAALAAGAYTELVFRPQTVQGAEEILFMQMRRIAVGTKAWARIWAIGQNTSTLDFFCGAHEYEG
jgi:hypothetical protein